MPAFSRWLYATISEPRGYRLPEILNHLQIAVPILRRNKQQPAIIRRNAQAVSRRTRSPEQYQRRWTPKRG
jgi:hypothetical protein